MVEGVGAACIARDARDPGGCSRSPTRSSATCRWPRLPRSAGLRRWCSRTSPGTRRDKAVAHLALAVAGSALITIGTAVNSSTVAAALVTLPVTFLIYFAGVIGPNAASGVTAALLPYVLPAASPGTMQMVPDRLAGWWMASVLGHDRGADPVASLARSRPRWLRRVGGEGDRRCAAYGAAWRGNADRGDEHERGQAEAARHVHGDSIPAYRPRYRRSGACERRRVARIGDRSRTRLRLGMHRTDGCGAA